MIYIDDDDDDEDTKSWMNRQNDNRLIDAIRETHEGINDDQIPNIIINLAVEFGHFDRALAAVKAGWRYDRAKQPIFEKIGDKLIVKQPH